MIKCVCVCAISQKLPMSVKYENCMTTTEMRMGQWSMSLILLEPILEEARVEPIVTVMRRMEWLGHVKRTDETENIRAVAEMKMEGKCLKPLSQ